MFFLVSEGFIFVSHTVVQVLKRIGEGGVEYNPCTFLIIKNFRYI